MASSNETPTRILDAAMRTIARRGPQRLSMSDVCDTAGISRGTLYRYFKSKDELLEAIGRHVQNELHAALDTAVERQPEPEFRLRVVADALVRHRTTHPEVSLVAEAEPGFALPFIRQSFPIFCEKVAQLLEPALDTLPSVRSGVVRPDDLAELLLRVTTSIVFIPETGPSRLVETVVAVFGGRSDSPWPASPSSRPEFAGSGRGTATTRGKSGAARTSTAKTSTAKPKTAPSNL